MEETVGGEMCIDRRWEAVGWGERPGEINCGEGLGGVGLGAGREKVAAGSGSVGSSSHVRFSVSV